MRLERGRQPARDDDHGHVEQDRRRGRNREAAPRVEDARGQRHHRHEADVGEHHARHQDGRVEALQARGHRPHQRRRRGHADHAGDQQRPGQHGGDGVDQPMRDLVAFGDARVGQQRHERLRERAFGEQAAQQVGDAERDVVGVGEAAGAEARGDQLLTHQAGHARGERQQRNRRGGLEKIHRGPTGFWLRRSRDLGRDYRKRDPGQTSKARVIPLFDGPPWCMPIQCTQLLQAPVQRVAVDPRRLPQQSAFTTGARIHARRSRPIRVSRH